MQTRPNGLRLFRAAWKGALTWFVPPWARCSAFALWLSSAQSQPSPALVAALEKPLDLETRRRAEQILTRVRDKGAPTLPEWLRANRTVESLWRIGTAEARQLLEAWAGDADGWHAAESRAVLALPKQVARKAG